MDFGTRDVPASGRGVFGTRDEPCGRRFVRHKSYDEGVALVRGTRVVAAVDGEPVSLQHFPEKDIISPWLEGSPREGVSMETRVSLKHSDADLEKGSHQKFSADLEQRRIRRVAVLRKKLLEAEVALDLQSIPGTELAEKEAVDAHRLIQR